MTGKPTPAADVSKLQAEVAELTRKLGEQTAKTTAAEDHAKQLASAQSVMIMQREIQEQPTGRKIKVQRLDRYDTVGHKDDGRPILKPVFKEVELETYFYKIDLPSSGGIDIKVNGISYQHGETYEFDVDQLRSIKDQVARSWAHEASIMGSNENAYRKPQNRVLRGAAH